MSLKNFLKVLVTALFAVALVACSSGDSGEDSDGADEADAATEDVAGGELRVAYSAQPDSLDVHLSTAIIAAEVMGHVFETLLTTDSDYNIKPMLAESYEQSEDGKTVTFHLRDDVVFHNGKEMTAEDVVASMNRWKEGPGGRGQFADSEFTAEDDYTVVLTMEEPLSTAVSSIAQGSSSFAAILPKESIENAESDEDDPFIKTDELIGTGPFKLEEWKQDQYIHLAKFDDYVGIDEPADGLYGEKKALVDDIYFEIVTDPSTRVAGLQSGEYDIAQEVPYDNADQLEHDEDIENNIIPGAGTLVMFTNKKVGPFTDPKAREALATLIDVEEMMTAAFTDPKYFTLNHNLMMPHQEEVWYSDEGKDMYNVNDPDKAKELFEEAGYDGEEITIMTSRDYEFMYNAAVVLQSDLESIGMDVKLDIYDWATLLDKMTDETAFDINMIWLGYKPEPTSHHFLNTEISGWTDSEELDELMEKFRSQPTLEDAQPVFGELQAWFYDYLPAVKVGDYNRVDSTRSTVDNYQYSDRMILWNVSNDK